jgi:hypothetical protein
VPPMSNGPETALLLAGGQLLEHGRKLIVAAPSQLAPRPRLGGQKRSPRLCSVPEAPCGEPHHLGPRILGIRRPPHAPHGLKLVDDLHHPLLRDPRPLRKLRQSRAGPVDQEEVPGLGRPQIPDPSVPKRLLDLTVESAGGFDQPPRKNGFPHRIR